MTWLLQIIGRLALPGVGRLISILTGGKAKIIGFLALALAFLGVVGFAYYKVSKWQSAVREVATLKEDIASLQQQLKAQQRAQRANERMLRSQIERARRLNRQLSGLLGELQNVRSDGCLDKPVPAAVSRLLGGKAENGSAGRAPSRAGGD